MVGNVGDIITYAEFQIEIFIGYDFTGGRIFDFPIDFCMGLTTVLMRCLWYRVRSLQTTVMLRYSGRMASCVSSGTECKQTFTAYCRQSVVDCVLRYNSGRMVSCVSSGTECKQTFTAYCRQSVVDCENVEQIHMITPIVPRMSISPDVWVLSRLVPGQKNKSCSRFRVRQNAD